MPKYNVTVKDTVFVEVVVEAADAEQAKEVAVDQYSSGLGDSVLLDGAVVVHAVDEAEDK